MAKESNIITNLKSVRESTGMTQQELADLIGMRRETILHLENNRYNPSLEMALKIAQVFNLKVEDLFELRQKEDAYFFSRPSIKFIASLGIEAKRKIL